jgi:hypothetical protein
MRKFFVLLFCIVQFYSFANVGNSRFFYDAYFGYRVHRQNFYNQLNTFDSYKASAPLQVVGIRGNEYFHTKLPNFFGNLSYSQILPQPVYIQDTIKGKITGGVIGLGLGFLLIKTKPIDVHFYIGFNTGRLRMYGNELLKQKNPFFSPKVGIQPWFNFGEIALTLMAEYEYDVSNMNWKHDQVGVVALKQSGITLQAGLSVSVSK